MIAEYHTDVANYYHGKGKIVFDTKQQQQQISSPTSSKTRGTLPVNYGVGYITTQSANLLLNDIKNKVEKQKAISKYLKKSIKGIISDRIKTNADGVKKPIKGIWDNKEQKKVSDGFSFVTKLYLFGITLFK